MLTGGMRALLEEAVEHFKGLWREGGPLLALLGWLDPTPTHKVSQGMAATRLQSLLSLAHPSLQHGLDLLRTLWCDVQLLEPADGTLAVGRPLRGSQGQANLCLGEAQAESAQLECLGKVLDLLQVDAVHHVCRRVADGCFWFRGTVTDGHISCW